MNVIRLTLKTYRSLLLFSRVNATQGSFSRPTSFVRNIACKPSRPAYARMSSVCVKNCVDDDRLQINLDLLVGNVTKTFNLNRLKNEELGIAIDRLRKNLEKKSKGKAKKKKKINNASAETQGHEQENDEEPSVPLPLEVLHNGESIPLSVSNDHAWISGAALRVGEEIIPITYNPPCVTLGNLCPLIMEAYPLFPDVEYEFCDVDSCEFHWKSVETKYVDVIKKNASNGVYDVTDTCVSFSYTPTKDDLDKHVLLMCIPKTKDGEKVGKTQLVMSVSAVVQGPETCPFEKRQKLTEEWCKTGEFRVISYNILAEVYTDTEWAKTHLFIHCPQYAMDMRYRKQLLLKEIAGYHPDLVCLQEVDKSVFVKQLNAGLSLQGYQGFFRPKKGGVSEGCATFVRKDKFKVVNQLDIALSDYLSSDESCKDLWDKICEVKALKEKVEQRSSILQVTIVESTERPGQFVCVANTHLYFHPHACNIRLIHAATALRYLQAISSAYSQEGNNISLIFCGDFNSSPDVGVYQLMTSQFIQKDHADWMSAGEEEAMKEVELNHALNIVSACGTPDFTHYGSPIQCTLDYIYAQTDHLQVVTSLAMPDLCDVTTHTYLPNPLIPSDHLALVADLKFKSV